MQIAHTQTCARRTWRRAAYGILAAALLAAAIAVPIERGGGWWLFFSFMAGPDLAVLLGISSAVEKGQLHRRAVPLYNALHSYWGPALLSAAAIVLPFGALVGALAWAFHISFDRCLGYGKRTRDGFQRT